MGHVCFLFNYHKLQKIQYLFFVCFFVPYSLFLYFILLEPAPCQEGMDLGILINHSNSIRYLHIKRLYKQFMPAFLLEHEDVKEENTDCCR